MWLTPPGRPEHCIRILDTVVYYSNPAALLPLPWMGGVRGVCVLCRSQKLAHKADATEDRVVSSPTQLICPNCRLPSSSLKVAFAIPRHVGTGVCDGGSGM